MKKRALALLSGAVTAGVIAAGVPWASAGTSTAPSGYEPVLNPKDFVKLIDNPYFPLPVGRTLIYRGVREGVTQTDRVHVSSGTADGPGAAGGPGQCLAGE